MILVISWIDCVCGLLFLLGDCEYELVVVLCVTGFSVLMFVCFYLCFGCWFGCVFWFCFLGVCGF